MAFAEVTAVQALPEFRAFDKIARLNREVVVTEKIDGTNALVHVADDGLTVTAGSRSRWITPENDNFGFARWVREHAEELARGLGPGYHYGEWWGAGIGRRYGLSEKRFSLFNTTRWTDEVRPACCGVVPELQRFVPVLNPGSSQPMRGVSLSIGIDAALLELRTGGSRAAPGFMRPEGVVVYHTASGVLFKVTLEGDAAPKGAAT